MNWSGLRSESSPPAPSAKAGCIDRAPARAVDNVLIAKLLAQLGFDAINASFVARPASGWIVVEPTGLGHRWCSREGAERQGCGGGCGGDCRSFHWYWLDCGNRFPDTCTITVAFGALVILWSVAEKFWRE